MSLRIALLFLLCITASGLLRPLYGEEALDQQQQPSEGADSKERLKFMLDALSQYKVEVQVGDETETTELLATPALRWSNTVSGTTDGIVGVWTRGGRPDVVVQFSNKKVWIHEFCSTSMYPFTMHRDGKAVWSPNSAGVTLKLVPDAPVPAETATRRLAQMRQIAERFEVIDDFRPKYGEPHIERTKLRLLPKPLYRYTDSADVVDGALFGLVISTDPEALLMVEAHKTDDGSRWHYALARMTVYALSASLDDKEVWSVPEKLAGSWAFSDPYYVGLYR